MSEHESLGAGGYDWTNPTCGVDHEHDSSCFRVPRQNALEARIQELEGALCVIEGMAERLVESKQTRDEIKAQVVRVLGVAPE